MPAGRSPRPLIDTINDAVSALTDVIRSLRATQAERKAAEKTRLRLAAKSAAKGTSRRGTRSKPRAIVVKATVKPAKQSVTARMRGKRHGITAKIEHAWDVLTRVPTTNGRRLPSG